MAKNPYYTQEFHGPHEVVDIGDFLLEEGITIRGCQIAYATLGSPSPAKDNVILMPA